MSTIKAIEPLAVFGGSRNWVFVRITTSDGVHGVGEATLEWHTESVVSAVREIAELLVGLDPSRIHDAWQVGYRARFWRGGPIALSALSGIEQALWDINGKTAGLPVYQLLGGAARDRLLVYANFPDGLTPQQMASDMREAGITGVKITPFAEPVLPADAKSGALQKAIDETAAVRDAIGPASRLAVDIHGRLTSAMSAVYAKAVEELDIWFIEEPALPSDLSGLARIAAATEIPIATGERLHTRHDFWRLLDIGAVTVVQPDLAHCGGIFEGRVIAAMAETHDVSFAPHNPLSPVNTAASAHVSLTAPNFLALEHKMRDTSAATAIVHSKHRLEDGYLHLSADPGLGVELDVDECLLHPPRTMPVPGPRRLDGSLAEW